MINRNNELIPLFEVDSKISIHEPKDAKNATFSVLKGMKKFVENRDRLSDIAIYKSEYEELGPSVLWKTSY